MKYPVKAVAVAVAIPIAQLTQLSSEDISNAAYLLHI
jgi:hypothetical protein